MHCTACTCPYESMAATDDRNQCSVVRSIAVTKLSHVLAPAHAVLARSLGVKSETTQATPSARPPMRPPRDPADHGSPRGSATHLQFRYLSPGLQGSHHMLLAGVPAAPAAKTCATSARCGALDGHHLDLPPRLQRHAAIPSICPDSSYRTPMLLRYASEVVL